MSKSDNFRSISKGNLYSLFLSRPQFFLYVFSPHLLWGSDKNLLSRICLITVQLFSFTRRPVYTDTRLLWKMQDCALYTSIHSKRTQSLQRGQRFLNAQNRVSCHPTFKIWIRWSRRAHVKCRRARGQRRYCQSSQTWGLIKHGIWPNTDLLRRDN